MKKIAVIYGSSRPSNVGKTVTEYFMNKANFGAEVEVDTIDLAEVNLPMIDEPMPPMMEQYTKDHTKAWSERIKGYDGFLFVVTTYNGGYAPITKNAIDTLYNEWTDKQVAFISYGAAPTSDGVRQLTEVVKHMHMNVVEETLHITPAHEAVTDEGVNEEMVHGEPEAVAKALVEALNK